MASEQQQQRSESVDHHSLLDDSNSNQSSGSSRSEGSSHHSSSVDIETNGSADESTSARVSTIVNPSASVVIGSVLPVMSVADSLSPVKPIVHRHEASPPPSSSSSSTIANHGKLALNHHASHLYTIEAILGLNNQHSKGKRP